MRLGDEQGLVVCHSSCLGGGFKDFLFSPLLGEMIQLVVHFISKEGVIHLYTLLEEESQGKMYNKD